VVLLEVSPLEELSTFLVVLSAFDELSSSEESESFVDESASELSSESSEELSVSCSLTDEDESALDVSLLLSLEHAVTQSIVSASMNADILFSIFINLRLYYTTV
jgi:hypothetical protein